MQWVLKLLLLFQGYIMCSISAESDMYLQTSMLAYDYSIGASEPMRISGAVFHAYENAWSVAFNIANANSILVFALCHEPCPPVTTEYRLYECLSMLRVLGDQQWYNQYISTHLADGERFCNDVRSAPALIQSAVDKILSDSNGGALVRFRHPNTLVIFYEEEVVLNWMTLMGDEFGLSFRATHIDVVGQHFGIRHFSDHVLLLNSTQRSEFVRGGLTFSLRNRCTSIGFAAPAFANVHSVLEAGRLRCVWDCRADMLRQPYNSAPPTKEQLNVSSPEYSLLPIKYECVQLPSVWVAAIFGFTVETALPPSDIGYAQALFDAVDRLSLVVNMELKEAGLQGIMVFSLKNSLYHSSFFDRLSELQQAACVIANSADDKCKEASNSIRNPDYVYRRRLLSSSQTAIEGLFVTGEKKVFEETNERERHLSVLRTSLVSAIQEHAPVLGALENIEDIDFSQIVAFETPKSIDKTTPSPTSDVDNATNVGGLLLLIGCLLGAVCVLALCFVSSS
jgi:hypothetical protein